MKSVTRSGGPRGCLGQARVVGWVVGCWGAWRVGEVGGKQEVMTRTGGINHGILARMGGSARLPGHSPGGSKVALALPVLALIWLSAALELKKLAFQKAMMAGRFSGLTTVGSNLAPCGSMIAFEEDRLASYINGLAHCINAAAFCAAMVIAYPDKAAAMTKKAMIELARATTKHANAVSGLSKANASAYSAHMNEKKSGCNAKRSCHQCFMKPMQLLINSSSKSGEGALHSKESPPCQTRLKHAGTSVTGMTAVSGGLWQHPNLCQHPCY